MDRMPTSCRLLPTYGYLMLMTTLIICCCVDSFLLCVKISSMMACFSLSASRPWEVSNKMREALAITLLGSIFLELLRDNWLVLDRLNLINSTVKAATSSFWYELHCNEQLPEASRTGSKSVVQFVLMMTVVDYSLMHIWVFYPSKPHHFILQFIFCFFIAHRGRKVF